MSKMSVLSVLVAATVGVAATLTLQATFKASESAPTGRTTPTPTVTTPTVLPWCEDGPTGPCLYPDDSLVLWFPNSDAFNYYLTGNK